MFIWILNFCAFFSIFNLTAEINSVTIFALLPINGIFLAITMYNMERVSDIHIFFFNFSIKMFYLQSEFDTVAVAFNILCLICLTWPTLYCYFATFTIKRIASIGDDTYFLSWYQFPSIMQKYFCLIIARSQINVQFTGLGLIYCSIETFGKVKSVSLTLYFEFHLLMKIRCFSFQAFQISLLLLLNI